MLVSVFHLMLARAQDLLFKLIICWAYGCQATLAGKLTQSTSQPALNGVASETRVGASLKVLIKKQDQAPIWMKMNLTVRPSLIILALHIIW